MGSGDNRKPVQQILSNIGQNFNTSVQAMANQPGITVAGLGLGMPKGIADVPVYLGGAVQEGWDYLRGNTQPHGERPLDKWEAGWRDLAINVGSLGQNTDVNRQEKERAAGASLTMTSMAAPGIPLPGIGKAFKGGAAGIAGENLVKGLSAAADYVAPAAGKLASPILDPALKAAGKTLNTAEKVTGNIAAGETKEWLKMMANSKSTTNYVNAQDSHVISTLSDKYNVPVARLDDLGEPLAQKYKESLAKHQEQVELYKTKKKVIKEQIKASELPGKLKSEVRKQLTEGLVKPGKPDNLDNFIAGELADIKMSKQSRHLLHEELKTNILYNQKYNDLNESKMLYDSMIEKSRKIREVAEEWGVSKYLKDLDIIEPQKIVNSAQRLRTNYDNIYNKALLSSDEETIKMAHSARLVNNQKIIDELSEINPKLAQMYDQTTSQSYVGQIGKYSNMFKAEPYIGDLTQVAESFPVVKINNAEALGIDYTQALKAEKGFGEWYSKNKKLTEDIILSKYKNQLKALHEYEGISFSNKEQFSKGVGSGWKVLQDKFDEFGYSFQSGARERLIENILLPSAYGQVKAWGRFAEGSVEFNNAVMNRTMKFMQDTGMIPTKMKTVARVGPNKFKTVEHLDQAMKSSIDKMAIPEAIKRELKSSALFMTTWVKGAAQAKLQSYNAIVESLRTIGKTGKVTDIQRQKILTGLAGIATTMAVFGARGMRVPGLFQEITDPTQSKIDETPETISTMMVNWIADTLKFDNDLRESLRDGFFKLVTGRTANRTESIPFFGAGLGNEIATSMIFSKGSKVLDAAIDSIKAGDPSLFMERAYGIITPTDIDKMVDQQVEGKSYDSKGVELNLPKRGTIIDQIGAVSKNLTPEYEMKNDPGYTEVDTSIKKEFGRLSFKDVLQEDNLGKLIDKSITVYPNDPEKAVDVIMKVVEEKISPESSKLYKKLGKNSNELLALPDEALKDYKDIQRLSEEQVAKLCAESLEFEEDSQTMMVLIKSGKFNPDDPNQTDMVVKAYEDMYDKVLKELE